MKKQYLSRNEFLKLGGSALLLSLVGNYNLFGQSLPNSQHLVDNALKREAYLKRLLEIICTDIGPHRFGTAEYEKVALIYKKEFELASANVIQDWVPFSMWEPTSRPVFRIGDTELETMPYKGISGTPKGGSTGILKKAEKGSSYKLVDSNDKVLATVTVNSFGRAISSSAYRNDREIGYVDPARPSDPVFNIGRQDVPALEAAVQNRIPVMVDVQTRFLPPKPGSSIIATIPGKSTEEILFLAHADSPYMSPGANDNTASVIVMLMLAHSFSGTVPNRTITYMATGGEEDGKVGAINYAEKRNREGTMKNIKYVVNFDSLTWGPNLQIYSRDNDIKNMISSIHQDLNIKAEPKLFDGDGYNMDSAPFRGSGGKAMYVNSRGYDGITLPAYHRPEDIPAIVGADCAEIGFLVFREYINRLQKI